MVVDFEIIPLENMLSNLESITLFTDSNYLYQITNTISNGVVSRDLYNLEPGSDKGI